LGEGAWKQAAFCLAGGLLRSSLKARGPFLFALQAAFKVNVLGSKAISFCLAGKPLKGQVKVHFVLPEGSPSRAGSRPGPAPALSGKHNRRLVLENAFASAFVMPPQSQNPSQNQTD
jgi:hypothetical protein